MKTKPFALFAALSLLSLAACKGPSSGSEGIIPYTSEDCIVTDNELGSMGDPVTIIYEGREIKFCCAPCEEEFRAEPEKFLSKLKN